MSNIIYRILFILIIISCTNKEVCNIRNTSYNKHYYVNKVINYIQNDSNKKYDILTDTIYNEIEFDINDYDKILTNCFFYRYKENIDSFLVQNFFLTKWIELEKELYYKKYIVDAINASSEKYNYNKDISNVISEYSHQFFNIDKRKKLILFYHKTKMVQYKPYKYFFKDLKLIYKLLDKQNIRREIEELSFENFENYRVLKLFHKNGTNDILKYFLYEFLETYFFFKYGFIIDSLNYEWQGIMPFIGHFHMVHFKIFLSFLLYFKLGFCPFFILIFVHLIFAFVLFYRHSKTLKDVLNSRYD
ncbi:MAG: hypothetical protein GY830_05915 [Bacteroidetes bacterium]|nr:hypothetical protein [Bacteroidota bacterium]